MIEWMKGWAQGIVIAVIIATILEMLLPENKNKKYINTVIGVYILFTIISPIISKFTGKTINIENYINEDTSLATSYTMNNIALLENNSNVQDVYIQTLKSDITNKLKEKGYNTNSINLEIDTNGGNHYGEILGIYLDISLIEENKISNVEEVNIDVSSNAESKKSTLSQGEINNVKEILMDIYGIEKDKIHIN